jgi:hypothetical protein
VQVRSADSLAQAAWMPLGEAGKAGSSGLTAQSWNQISHSGASASGESFLARGLDAAEKWEMVLDAVPGGTATGGVPAASAPGGGPAASGTGGIPAAPVTTTVTVTVGKNTATWVLDADGNPLSVSGTLREYFTAGTRTSAEIADQAAAAARGLATDQGGHLIGFRFFENQGGKNLFPQDANFNNSSFKILENDYARMIDNGLEVEFRHTLSSFQTARPDIVTASYRAYTPTGDLAYIAALRFNNQAGKQYTRRIW